MDEEKKKEGVSVKELENYAKKHRFEIFFCILFILASLFTLIFWGPTISIFLAGIGGIISVLLPEKIEHLSRKFSAMAFKQQGTTQLIIGIVALIVAIFLAPIIFLLMGLHAGKSMMNLSKESLSSTPEQGE